MEFLLRGKALPTLLGKTEILNEKYICTPKESNSNHKQKKHITSILIHFLEHPKFRNLGTYEYGVNVLMYDFQGCKNHDF
jgi:hypothetical protein